MIRYTQVVFILIAKVILLKQGLWLSLSKISKVSSIYCKGYSIKTRIVTSSFAKDVMFDITLQRLFY